MFYIQGPTKFDMQVRCELSAEPREDTEVNFYYMTFYI